MTACVSKEADAARLDWAAALHDVSGGHWHAAVGRFYYAAFHATTALLLAKTGRRAKTHAGHAALMAQMVQDAPDEWSKEHLASLNQLMRMRHEADYFTTSSITSGASTLARDLAGSIVSVCLSHPLVVQAELSAQAGSAAPHPSDEESGFKLG